MCIGMTNKKANTQVEQWFGEDGHKGLADRLTNDYGRKAEARYTGGDIWNVDVDVTDVSWRVSTVGISLDVTDMASVEGYDLAGNLIDHVGRGVDFTPAAFFDVTDSEDEAAHDAIDAAIDAIIAEAEETS